MVSENLGFSPNNARAVEPVEVTPTSMSQTSLSFSDLCRMADPTTEPSDIVHSLKSGLDGLLVEHAVSTEIQELVFIVVGSFCEKGEITVSSFVFLLLSFFIPLLFSLSVSVFNSSVF